MEQESPKSPNLVPTGNHQLEGMLYELQRAMHDRVGPFGGISLCIVIGLLVLIAFDALSAVPQVDLLPRWGQVVVVIGVWIILLFWVESRIEWREYQKRRSRLIQAIVAAGLTRQNLLLWINDDRDKARLVQILVQDLEMDAEIEAKGDANNQQDSSWN